MSGELEIGEGGIKQDSYDAIMWNSTLSFYFGEVTKAQLIMTGSVGTRTYGPRTTISIPITLRLSNNRAITGQSNTYLSYARYTTRRLEEIRKIITTCGFPKNFSKVTVSYSIMWSTGPAQLLDVTLAVQNSYPHPLP